MLEGRAHIARRLHVGADEPLARRGSSRSRRGGSIVAVYSAGNRSCREVCASTSWMAATILPDLSAPSRMRWRLAGRKLASWKICGARNDQLHRPPRRARSHGRQHRLHLQRVLLAEAAAGKGRDHLHLSRRRCRVPSPSPWRIASAFCVPSWMVSLSPCHSATVAISSIGFWCCGGQSKTRLDLDRRLRERLVGVARDDLGDEGLQRRVGLIDGFGPGASSVTLNGSVA